MPNVEAAWQTALKASMAWVVQRNSGPPQLIEITEGDDTDPQRAVREARLQIAFYLTVRTYDSLVELHGWHDQVAAIRAAFRSGRPDTISEHVTDEMLWAIAICGDTAQARQMLKSRTALPDTAFLSPPNFLVGRRRRSEYDAAAVEFASANLG